MFQRNDHIQRGQNRRPRLPTLRFSVPESVAAKPDLTGDGAQLCVGKSAEIPVDTAEGFDDGMAHACRCIAPG